MATINASSSTVIPQTTYGTWWIDTININNKNRAKPLAMVRFVLCDALGNPSPMDQSVVYPIDIVDKITKGDSDLATLFTSIVGKAAALAIADGKLPATIS